MQHFVLTRFSYRGARVNTGDDPLDAGRLHRRMRLFEAITAPSLANQTNQGFEWVIIVDPELPGRYRADLHELTKGNPRTHVVEYHPKLDVEGLEWLDRLSADPEARWVLTTNLDDDDALANGFLAAAQRQARGAINHVQPLTLIGAESVREWRFIPRRDMPLGSVGPWRRSVPVSAGLSLLCDRHALDLSVLAMQHRDASFYGAEVLPADLPVFRRRRIERVHRRIRLQLHETRPEALNIGFYQPYESPEAVALMVSHLDNIQAARIVRPDPDRLTDAAAALPRFGVDVERAAVIAPDQRLGWHNAFHQARRLYRAETWPGDDLRAVRRVRLVWSAGRRVLVSLHQPRDVVPAPSPAEAPAHR